LDRILDVGTGTGWTAGLLSSYAGDENVTSIEVDQKVAAQVRKNLEQPAGFAPHLLIGDGGDGCAPYDLVHVAFGVETVPYTWIAQTRPGGSIVLPWSPGTPGGFRLPLDVLDDGTTVGRFDGRAGYMMMCSQRHTTLWRPHHVDDAERGSTSARV
jgi:protein-L-isoaspartate(D-aspartate) O-methyltransferase